MTLLEVLTALGILAIALPPCFEVARAGLERMEQANTEIRNELILNQLISRVGVDIPLMIGDQHGVLNGDKSWSVSVHEMAPAKANIRLLQIDAVLEKESGSETTLRASLLKAVNSP
jgi:hypothetical protein